MGYDSKGIKAYFATVTGVTATATGNYIGEVVSFSGPSGAAAIIDMTHLASSFKEKKMGLPDEGQVTMEVNMIATNVGQEQLLKCRRGRTRGEFSVRLTDTGVTKLDCEAYCLSYVPSGGVDAPLRAAVTLELNGLATWSTVAIE